MSAMREQSPHTVCARGPSDEIHQAHFTSATRPGEQPVPRAHPGLGPWDFHSSAYHVPWGQVIARSWLWEELHRASFQSWKATALDGFQQT